MKNDNKKTPIIRNLVLDNPGKMNYTLREVRHKETTKMYSIALKSIERTYKNNGQHAEQIARFTLTGEIVKADNKPFTVGADCLDIQIKSARATICKGTDIEKHLRVDKANRYGYVLKDFSTMYIMTKAEYYRFASLFSTKTRESEKNGGAEKLRFKDETAEMLKWLATM